MFRQFFTTRKNFLSPVRINLTRICLAIGLLATGGLLLRAERGSARDTQTVSSKSTAASEPTGEFESSADFSSPGADGFVSRLPVQIRGRDPDRFAAADGHSSPEMIVQRIAYRYGNPTTSRFLSSLNTDQSLQMYLEASRLIDSRHLEPSTYATRVRQALVNLSYAADSREFLLANRISPTERQISDFRSALESLYRAYPVQTAGDALNMLYRTMDPAARHLGLNPTTVALEFINGATESLDNYSAFVPEDAAGAPSAALSESIVGIGAEIEPHDLGVRIVKPLRGSPAEEAGLLRGDLITKVNGQTLAGKGLDYAVELITGPVGSRLLLSITRDGKAISPVSIIRRRVQIPSVSEYRMLSDGSQVGYIKLDQFTETSEKEMDEALWSLHREGMKSLVIDLRGNPGGLLTTAISLSNKFLPCGSIVSTRGRNPEDESAEYATYEQTWKVPLVVLVDENSASASEIFAAAIQENQRGQIIGRKTYGKGTVQTHFPLQSASGTLRLTTARFYSPNGRVMAGTGVEPDYAVESSSLSENELDSVLQAGTTRSATSEVREMALAKSGCRLPHHRTPVISS